MGVKKARIAQFREEMKLIHYLLEGKEVNEASKLYKIESVKRSIPLYTAVWGPRMQEVSGELADGVVIMGPERADVFADKMKRVKDAAAKAGRNPNNVKIVLQVTGAYSDDPQPLINKYKSLAIHHMQRLGYEGEYPDEFRDIFDRIRKYVEEIAMPEGESPGTELVPDEFVHYSLMVGTEAHCVQRLKEILALEPDEVVFSIGYATPKDIQKAAHLFKTATGE